MTGAARTYRGISATDRAAGRRKQLLDAGIDLLGTVGFDQTTMTAVCAHARLTERYFYESFRSRQDLLIAVCESVAESLRTEALSRIAATEGDSMAKLRAGVSGFVEILVGDPRVGRVALVEVAAADFMRAERRKLMRQFHTLIIEQARELFADDALPPPRDAMGAMMFVGGCSELITEYLDGHVDGSPDDIVDAAVHLFTTSMRTAQDRHHEA